MAAEDAILCEFKTLNAQKKTMLISILTIAYSQAEMIEQDDVEALRVSMERRMTLSESIDQLDAHCINLKRALRSVTDMGAVDINDVESGLMQLILQIQTVDQVNAQGLRTKIGEYQKSIKQLRLSGKSRVIYTQAYDQYDGVFFDVKK